MELNRVCWLSVRDEWDGVSGSGAQVPAGYVIGFGGLEAVVHK